jgi:hypothetical protein
MEAFIDVETYHASGATRRSTDKRMFYWTTRATKNRLTRREAPRLSVAPPALSGGCLPRLPGIGHLL